jgi:NAD(P)-dependent dehydrogenase (short-subunit alcohol dehydrogenase family)
MKSVFPHMRDSSGGSIVNFTSLAAESGVELLGDYAAAKMAVQGLSKTAAREWGRYGIRVNCIAPVALNPADVGDHVRDPERIREYGRRIPLGHKGDAEDEIAGAAMFLASDDSKFVTGTVVHVDGGIHLTGLPRNEMPD